MACCVNSLISVEIVAYLFGFMMFTLYPSVHVLAYIVPIVAMSIWSCITLICPLSARCPYWLNTPVLEVVHVHRGSLTRVVVLSSSWKSICFTEAINAPTDIWMLTACSIGSMYFESMVHFDHKALFLRNMIESYSRLLSHWCIFFCSYCSGSLLVTSFMNGP